MKIIHAFLLLAGLMLTTAPAHAYIGPGGGLSAIGALFALVAALAVTFFAFLWYPIKRLRRKLADKKQAPSVARDAASEPELTEAPRP